MKKLALTIAIVLGMGIAASAQGGLFQYGFEDEYGLNRGSDGMFSIGLPSEHGMNGHQDAPLAGGALLLIGFGAAYALKKRNEK